jgi:hypothetical protein
MLKSDVARQEAAHGVGKHTHDDEEGNYEEDVEEGGGGEYFEGAEEVVIGDAS